jgi:hypothetical protein
MRIQRGDASFAANVLGARGPLLTVLAHFFEHGRWGSPVRTGVGRQTLTAEDQLLILMQAGLYLTAPRGLVQRIIRFRSKRAFAGASWHYNNFFRTEATPDDRIVKDNLSTAGEFH